ncbi:tRNA-splicing endonuclease subunit Sen2 [Dissostichus eleginoides]|uniref:tRNA-splicing endonuclease subunit Sen2 n=1 Tax=Dissostichus eleginoides TaxID=100907 RepID=A0AAD9FGE3_DISEL|nr:tRNA-splicing endonuclease subunit Sen2 [Dissostichus eleginoides]
MQAEFRAPRRRPRVHEAFEAPLPVNSERSEYRAELINQNLLVVNPEHIKKIHNQGFFGKGVLSRARPDYSISDQWEQHEGFLLPVVSTSRYDELLRWAGASLSAQGLDEAAVSQTLLSVSQPVEMEDVSQGLREVRRSPLSLTEYLQLSLEEEPLSISQLWRKFRSLRPDFVSSFSAYQHLRSKGWVPKEGGGAKYGVDLMLYRRGPPFYHASYSVVIERVDGAFRGSTLRPFSWRSLAALSRITANVSKELMLCYIIYPAGLSEAELDSPVCLSRLSVQEVIVSRWVSSKERTEQEDI